MIMPYIIKTHCMSYFCVFKRSLLGVKICLSHAHIGLLWGLNSKFPTSIPVCFIWESPPSPWLFRLVLKPCSIIAGHTLDLAVTNLLHSQHTNSLILSHIFCWNYCLPSQTGSGTHALNIYSLLSGRRGGLMVSALDSGASGPGSSPGWGHNVLFLGKTVNSHSASLHPGV